MWVADVTYRARNYFSVNAADGLLATSVGPYAGRVLIEDAGRQSRLEIRASGPWTINLWSLEVIDTMGGSRSGTADDVFEVSAEALSIRHSGDHYFSVTCHAADGQRLLATRIGPYSGDTGGCESAWVSARSAS